MAEVFISYGRASEAVAKRVEGALKAAGHGAWRDDQLPAHQAYAKVIEQRLRGADAVVVLWSAQAAQSEWVRAEADFARSERKLVQAQLDDTLPPIPFNQIQCADLRGWRGHRNHKGWVKLAESVASVASGEAPKAAEPSAVRWRRGFDRRLVVGAIAALLLIMAAVLFVLDALKANRPPTLAVLPFASLAASDDNLVDGIWEDTREALSGNPQLTVIGRTSAETMARDDLEPRQYRSRYGIDYLLDGKIRRAGNKIRFNVSLVRTKDGAQVWSESFDRQLKDVFALQAEIAREIEGRIRGRLARGGGTVPENISTTPEVYALYNDARATVRKLDLPNMPTAIKQLQRAIQLDPNYAPAWATFALADYHTLALSREGRPGSAAESAARRAIALAPNLAIAHAALGYVHPGGPESEAAIRRAIELDPNDADALTWLASTEALKGRTKDALELLDRAAQIEPLSPDVVMTRLELLLYLHRTADVQRELDRLQRSRAIALNGLARMRVFEDRRDLSEAARAGLAAYKASPPQDRGILGVLLAATLLELEMDEVAVRVTPVAPRARLLWVNDPRGLALIDKMPISPADFWSSPPLTQMVCRNLVYHHRDADLVRLYREGAGSPEKLLARSGGGSTFLWNAPFVAMALRNVGNAGEADAILALADERQEQFASGPTVWKPGVMARQARIRAVQGRRAEAAKALAQAVRGGWYSTPPVVMPDLLLDPPLALLKGTPEFRKARTDILNFVARERSQLGPVDPEQVPMAPRPPAPLD